MNSITIQIKEPNKAAALIQYLKSLDFISVVEMYEDNNQYNNPSDKPEDEKEKNRLKSNLFKQYEKGLTLIKDNELYHTQEAKDKFSHLVELLTDNLLYYQMGIELTSQKSIFVTLLEDNRNLEVHLEYFFEEKETKETVLFQIFEGEDPVGTGWDSLENCVRRINEFSIATPLA